MSNAKEPINPPKSHPPEYKGPGDGRVKPTSGSRMIPPGPIAEALKPTSGYDHLPFRSECPPWLERVLDFLFNKIDIAKNVEEVQPAEKNTVDESLGMNILKMKKVLYLRRYKIVDTMFGYVYLHNIQRPDEDKDPHDHPWNFMSVLLNGGYDECLFGDDAAVRGPIIERRARGSVSVRGKDTIHKIVSVLPATWTLVVCTPRYREWGFITSGGWVPWR